MVSIPTGFMLSCYLQGTFKDARDALSLTHIVAFSRCIDGDLTLLAAVLDIPDEEVTTIKSKFKAVQGQTYHMLHKWHSSVTRPQPLEFAVDTYPSPLAQSTSTANFL